MSKARRNRVMAADTDMLNPAGLESELLLVDPVCRIVDTVPAVCPHCSGARSRILAQIREIHYLGVAPNGEMRTHITWYRVVCTHCEKPYAVAQHEMRTGG